MYKQSLISDAWIREAEEASKLVEDLVNRVNYKSTEELQVIRYNFNNAKSKLSELGVKLDRLESLLLNPPPKPILTDQELEFRWKMLLDIQSRTRALAHNLYSSPSTKRLASVTDAAAAAIAIRGSDQEHSKATFANEDAELVTPLITNDAPKSQMLGKLSISEGLRVWIWKAFWIILAVLGSMALLLAMFIICAII